MKYVISGGSGFVGCRVIYQLLQDKEVTSIKVLTRNADFSAHANLGSLKEFCRADCDLSLVQWDPNNVTEELVNAIEGSDAVLHLCGTSIFQKRWSEAFKKDLVDSRVTTSQVLVYAIGKCKQRPKVLVSASGVSYYGDAGDTELEESSPVGKDFLAKLSQDWENAVSKAEEFGVRTCFSRIGIVLGIEGGALAQMLPLFEWHIGGHVGNGQQWFPWVHVDDCARALIFAAKNSNITGPFNNASPNPVRMKEFCQALGAAKNRWSWAHAPYITVRLILGEVANVITASLRIKPKALEENGFEWNYSTVQDALANILPKDA